jgi:alkylation response protein AidB-like acyl-CoA dehydrogenase
VDFAFTEEQEKFREEIKDFLKTEIEQGNFIPRQNAWAEEFSKEFSQKIAKKGWIALTWPKKYGGADRSYIERTILMEELMRYQAPLMCHFVGERQIGPSLIHFGSEELKEEFLPKIINAEITFCLGMSEPDAGSDVGSTKTTAREEGDYFVINGQKIWTSHAHHSDYIWLVAVTDLEGPKHKNLSEFIVDTKIPGVTINPLYNMIGVHSFNEVFFDDVKVHKKYLVGEKNRGFYQMLAQIDYERAGIERLMQNYPLFVSVKEYVKNSSFSLDSLVRDKLAQLEIEFQVGRLLVYHVAWVIDQGRIPNYEAAISKAFCTQFEQRLGNVVTEMLGQFGHVIPGFENVPLKGDAAASYLWNPAYTVQGGTLEILKNVIATRGLSLRFKKS